MRTILYKHHRQDSDAAYCAEEFGEILKTALGVTRVEKIPCYFIDTKAVDVFPTKFYQKRLNSTKKERRQHRYFIPQEGVNLSEVESEIKRGRHFFKSKEGFQFGALSCLRKLGDTYTLNA